MDTTPDTTTPDRQTFRDFLDHGSIRDTATTYPDGSRREPTWSAADDQDTDQVRPLRASQFKARTK